MADSTTKEKTVRLDAANKYLYFAKLDDEPTDAKAWMIGLQGQSSGTNTKTLQTIQTKTVDVKMAGSANQQRTVLAYFQKGDGLFAKLKHAWQDNIIVHLYRVDMNDIKGDKPNRTAPAEYSQCIIATLPQTETLNSVMQSNVAFEVQGLAQNGTVNENMLEDNAFDLGRALYGYLNPTEVGGSTAENTVGEDINKKAEAPNQN